MILVIEPHRMLQHAIALFLSPAHEIEVTETVPESLSGKDFDAVIVDAASLRETRGLDSEAGDRIRNWKIPILWIESAESSQTPEGEKLVVMKRPMARDTLGLSLAKCLGASGASHKNGPLARGDHGKTPAEKHAASAVENLPVIELVDVVEDDPS